MGTPLEERIAKLPKWARDYIWKLESNIHSLEKQLGQIADVDTGVYWRDLKHRQGLPDRARIVFITPGGEIEASIRDGAVHIYGLGTLLIQPIASNAIQITTNR